MNSYFANFTGKKPSTIGLPYLMDVYINAENKEQAIQQVYDKYIMVTGLKMQHVPDTTPYKECIWCSGTGRDIYEDDIVCVECDGRGKGRGMKVLIACEYSGRVRDAFALLGHDAISCDLLPSDSPKIAIENPIGCISTMIHKPSQIIQPYEFGEDASKATCLWLKNLPLLKPTEYYPPRMVDGKKRWDNQTDSGNNALVPGKDRWKERSLTYQGIADAMANQWGIS